MRLFVGLTLLFSLACATTPSAPSQTSYPVVVAEGTFLQFEPCAGDNYFCEVVLYRDADLALCRRPFYIGGRGQTHDVYELDRVVLPEPIYPYNRITITRTGDHDYVIAKAE